GRVPGGPRRRRGRARRVRARPRRSRRAAPRHREADRRGRARGLRDPAARPGELMRRGGWVVVALPMVILVLLTALLFGSARREDVGQLADRATARLLLATHLRSAAAEAWWVLSSTPVEGETAPGFQTIWDEDQPNPSSFDETLNVPRAAAAA